MTRFNPVTALRQIMDADLTASQKLVALCLVKHADYKGQSYPSMSRIADQTGIHKTTVIRAVHELIKCNVLCATVKAGCKTRYQLVATENWLSNATGSNGAPLLVAMEHQTGSNGAPELTQELTHLTNPVLSPRKTTSKNGTLPPEWLPLQLLDGFQKPTLKTMKLLVAHCQSYGVDPLTVTTEFAHYWPVGRLKHDWVNPVRAMMRTLEIQIEKVKRGKPQTSPGVRRIGSQADFIDEKRRLGK